MNYRINNQIADKSKVFGLPLKELLYVGSVFILFVLTGFVASFIGFNAVPIFVVGALLSLVALGVTKYFQQQGHPTVLSSSFAYLFLQPRSIICDPLDEPVLFFFGKKNHKGNETTQTQANGSLSELTKTEKTKVKDNAEKRSQKDPKEATFNEVSPIAFNQDGILITKTGDIVVGFRMQLPNQDQMSYEDYQRVNNQFVGLFKSLPSGTIVHQQNLFFEQPFRKNHIEGHFGKEAQNYFGGKPMLFGQTHIYLCFPENPKDMGPTGTCVSRHKKNKLRNFVLKGLDKRLEKAASDVDQFINMVNGGGYFSVTMLTSRELEEEIYHYLNLDFSSELCPEERLTLKNTLSFEKEHLKIGSNYVGIVSMSKLGKEVADSYPNKRGLEAPMITPLSNELDFPHILNVTFRVEDREKQLRGLDLKRKLLSSLGSFANQKTSIEEVATEDFTAQIRAQGMALVSTCVNVCTWNADPDKLAQNNGLVLSAFKDMAGNAGASGIVETFDALNLFFAGLPGNCSNTYRYQLMPDQQSATFLNSAGSYVSKRGTLFFGPNGATPIEIDTWGLSENKNLLLIGASGTGKSYGVNHLVTEDHEMGRRNIILDMGAVPKEDGSSVEKMAGGSSYKGLCMVLGGKYFDDIPRINPFNITKREGKYKLSKEKALYLKTILSTIWLGPETALTQVQADVLALIIRDYYRVLNHHNLLNDAEDTRKPSAKDFFYFLENYAKVVDIQREAAAIDPAFEVIKAEEVRRGLSFIDVEEIIFLMEKFATGDYKEMLNAEDEEDLTKHRLIVFDLKKFRDDANVYPIITLAIMELIKDQLSRHPGEEKSIWLDEAWDMLTGKMKEFVEYLYRTIRKDDGRIALITQGIEEIAKLGETGDTLILNSALKILMDHSQESQTIPKLTQKLGLTPHQVDLLHSVKNSPHKSFRRFLLKVGDKCQVLSFRVTPYANVAYNTRAKIRNLVQEYADEYGGNTRAAYHFAIKRILEEQQQAQV